MAFEVIIWIVNILCILHVRQVTSQAAVLDIENCENSTLAGNNINITFRLKDGSFPALALLTVQFYRNGVKPTPDCIVERTIPCNTAGIPPYCGCTEDGTDKVFYYEITSVSVNQAGDWTTAVEHVNDPTQTIRSPVCQLTVTSPTTTMPTTIGTSAYTSTVPGSSLPNSTWSVATSTPNIPTENGSSLATTTVDTATVDDGHINPVPISGIVGGIVGGFIAVLIILTIILYVIRKKGGSEQNISLSAKSNDAFDHADQPEAKSRPTSRL